MKCRMSPFLSGFDVVLAAVVPVRDQEAVRSDGRRGAVRRRRPLLPQRAPLDRGRTRGAALHGRQPLQHPGTVRAGYTGQGQVGNNRTGGFPGPNRESVHIGAMYI